ncbi:MAG: hypothetical protein ACHQNT_07525 [Bacteroidia bacterium]
MQRIATIFFLFIISSNITLAQDIFYHLSNTTVYDFLDELAIKHIISLNTCIKPYSRKLIAEKLNEASQKHDQLSVYEKKQLDFLLRDFNKELLYGKKSFKKRIDIFYYKDSLFTLSLNPIAGIQYWKNENDDAYHRWIGAEFFATVGTHLGIYASLRDNHESRFLELPPYLTQRTGAVYKNGPKDKGGDFSEARGGIVYSWKWGHAGIIKDHFVWGNNYHGANIFSGHSPSFPHIKFNIKPVSWFEFNYIHGFLVSDVLDTSRSYVAGVKERDVFFPKFLAANMYTITPFKNLNVSFGNSIVYSDEFQLAYIIPVYFFKSADHTLTNTSGNFTGQNSQMYFDISSRQLKYLHIYLSIFIDEISLDRFWEADKQSNFISMKAGAAVSHPFIPNTTFIAEYTRTNPEVYKHFVSTTTFESNDFNLGHYLRDNAEEIYFGIRYNPFSRLYVNASFTLARTGENYPYLGTGGSGHGLPFINTTKWKNQSISAGAKFEIINDGFLFAEVELANVTGDSLYVESYTPEIFRGKTTTFTGGINFGF